MNYKNLIKPYIEHLEKGFSEKSFVPCDFAQLEEFAQKENLMLKIEMAKRASLKFWESLAINALKEDFEFFKSELWIFVMKSRFGWSDEPKIEKDNEQKTIEVQLMVNPDQKLPGIDDTDSNEYQINNS
jgi:hypothetical protein